MGVIINVHIQKTGGTTMARMLRSTFGLHHVDLYYPPPLEFLDRKYYKELQFYWQYHARSISSHNLRFVPPQDFWPGAKFMIFLRDPVERSLSYFHHIRRGAPHLINAPKLPAYSENINAWFEHEENCNYMTKFLNDLNESGHTSKQHLEQAKIELRKYHCIGITEKFEDSLFSIREILLPELSPHIEYHNTNPIRVKNTCYAENISESELRVVRKNNLLDIELYEYGFNLLQEQLKRIKN